MTAARIFLVDDDESLRRVTSYHLEQAGFAVTRLASAEEALRALEAAERKLPSSAFPQILITDVRMPGMDGLSLLRLLKERWPQLGVIVITAHGSVEDAVDAMRAGAHDYLLKPFEHETLRLSVDKSLRLSELLRENRRLRALAGDRLRLENMIASSEAMDELLRMAAQVAPRTTTVLLLGESGTGKEVLARAIHHASERREGPFVAISAGSLPESLIDSELFGHRKGAFTGADRDRKGKFELAEGGTLFLDEIGELHPELQVKLLRALQEREVDPLGASASVKVDVRVIAATNRDLEAMVSEGSFREDLYYRLAVVTLVLPPLRERRDDILPLSRHFAARIAAANDQPVPAITADAERVLNAYDWPGNVRELENVMERALALHPEGPIEAQDLPARLRSQENASPLSIALPEDGLDLTALEKELIQRALVKCKGNRSATARYLGLTRNTLNYRLEKYGIGDPD